MKRPNLFIVGAPKCGTTSLAAWLSTHPKIFVCPVKEPEFFNEDMRFPHRYSLREYESLFSQAPGSVRYRVDASANYLYSEVAIPTILEYAPDAKFIVMVRNPVEMAVSLHGQKLREGIESVRDFSTAWKLQERRREGLDVPKLCPEAKTLIYGHVCLLGVQIERLLDLASAEQVHIQILDYVKADPRQEYLRLLRFLGLEDDGRSTFPVHNAALELPRPVAIATRLAGEFKRRLRIGAGLGLITAMQLMFGRTLPDQEVSDEVTHELRQYFKEDIAILSDRLAVDLTPWLEGRSVAQPSKSGVRLRHRHGS